MTFLENLSDDQLAAIFCVLAFVFCVGILAIVPGLRERTTRVTRPSLEPSTRFLSRKKRMSSH